MFGCSEWGDCLASVLWNVNAPLYSESAEFEYMACPNQDGIRFGNHYHYNSYQQRSEEPDTTKKSSWVLVTVSYLVA